MPLRHRQQVRIISFWRFWVFLLACRLPADVPSINLTYFPGRLNFLNSIDKKNSEKGKATKKNQKEMGGLADSFTELFQNAGTAGNTPDADRD